MSRSWRKPGGRIRATAVRSRGKDAARGFTLIELLVVIALLAVLAGLLFSTLAQASAAARTTVCLSNARQFALAAQLYWDDHDGRAFRYRSSADVAGDVYWFGWLERGAEGARRFDFTRGVLHAYLGGRGVEVCPSLDYSLRQFKRKALGAACGYGYNLHLSTPPHEPPLTMDRVQRPAEIVLFADAAQVNTFQAPASPLNPLLEEFYYVNAQEATVHFRHRARAVIAACDGHADTRRGMSGSFDSRLPQQRVGKLEPAALVVP